MTWKMNKFTMGDLADDTIAKLVWCPEHERWERSDKPLMVFDEED